VINTFNGLTGVDLVGVFAKLRKAVIRFIMLVVSYGKTRLPLKFDIGRLFENLSSRKLKLIKIWEE
jgi:hypothetical protein